MTRAVWLGIGFLGQMTFSLRFLVQWWRSERAGRSVVPLAFWYLSLVGGVLLLFYAIYRRDPVFILGQLTGVFVELAACMGGVGRPRPRASPAATPRRDPLPVGRVGDVASRRLAGAAPQRRPL